MGDRIAAWRLAARFSMLAHDQILRRKLTDILADRHQRNTQLFG